MDDTERKIIETGIFRPFHCILENIHEPKDVQIQCKDNKLLTTSKFLLAAASSFFEKALKESECGEDEVLVIYPDIDVESMTRLLGFLSYGECWCANQTEAVIIQELLEFFQLKTIDHGNGGHQMEVLLDDVRSEGTKEDEENLFESDMLSVQLDNEDNVTKDIFDPMGVTNAELPARRSTKRKAKRTSRSNKVLRDYGPMSCKECGQQFSNLSSFSRHRLKQHRSRPTCQDCGKSFADIQGLKTHSKTIHLLKERPFECELCGRKFKTKGVLTSHQQTHVRVKCFVCDECGFQTTTKLLLKTHQLTHKPVKKYQCDKCDKSFNFKHAFETHLRKHNGETPFPCQECGQKFISRINLSRHASRVHRHARQFECNICMANFKDRPGLRRHIILHSDVKPFECIACGESFKHREAGRRHLRAVHQGRDNVSIRFIPSNSLQKLEAVAIKRATQQPSSVLAM